MKTTGRINCLGFYCHEWKNTEITCRVNLNPLNLYRFQGLIVLTKYQNEKGKKQNLPFKDGHPRILRKIIARLGAARSTQREKDARESSVARGTAINGRLDRYHSPSP